MLQKIQKYFRSSLSLYLCASKKRYSKMIEDKNQQRTSLAQLGEFGLIDHLTQNFKITQASTLKGIGDDAAV